MMSTNCKDNASKYMKSVKGIRLYVLERRHLAYTFRKNTFTNLTNASYLMKALFYNSSMINNPVF